MLGPFQRTLAKVDQRVAKRRAGFCRQTEKSHSPLRLQRLVANPDHNATRAALAATSQAV